MLEASDEGLDVEDLADHAGLDGAPEREEVGVPTSTLMHAERQACRGRAVHEVVSVGGCETHRLLDDDVTSAVEAGPSEIGVKHWRGRDDDDFGGVTGEQFIDRGERRHVTEVASGCLETLRGGVDGCSQTEPFGLGAGEAVQVAHPTEGPVADNGDSDVLGAR